MNAVAATITAADQSIPPSKSAARRANHAPDAAVQRRSHRVCSMLLGAFLASVRKICSRDSALWRVNTSSGSPGAGINPCLERGNREFGLHLMVICSSSISLRSRWARKAALTSPDQSIEPPAPLSRPSACGRSPVQHLNTLACRSFNDIQHQRRMGEGGTCSHFRSDPDRFHQLLRSRSRP